MDRQRERSEAGRRRVPARFAAWAALGAALLLAPASRADRVVILDTDREAIEARVELMLQAQREVRASYFIIGDDPFSLTSLSLLRDAARRGLTVRLLVDAQWNKIPPALVGHLESEGIEIREYHPFRLDKLGWIFRRMHDKLLIGDDRDLVAGGRNIESTYFGFGRQIKQRNYIDCDLRVQGQAATEARDYFDRLWASGEVRPVVSGATPAERLAAGRKLAPHKAWLDRQVEEARHDPERAREDPVEVGPVRFLHDPVGPKGSARGVSHELLSLLDQARESALIESPYLIPSHAFRRGLKHALARGVRVRILTNSLGSTDNLLAQAGYVGKKGRLVKSGVEIWEYQGPECLHAKAAVIDGETGIVGSFNLDPRSEFLNTEIALSFKDRALAGQLAAILDSHLANSVRIDARGWPEGATGPFPGIPRLKVVKLRLLQLLAPFIERQL